MSSVDHHLIHVNHRFDRSSYQKNQPNPTRSLLLLQEPFIRRETNVRLTRQALRNRRIVRANAATIKVLAILTIFFMVVPHLLAFVLRGSNDQPRN